MIVDVIGVVFSSLLLILAARFTVDAFDRLVVRLEIDGRALAVVLIALSTSLPELFVGVVAALEKTPEISLGNVLGSNIANLSLVIGGASLLAGSISVVGEFMKKEFFTAFLTGLLPLVLIIDGNLSRLDGVFLLFIYVLYIKDVMRMGKHKSLLEKRRRQYGLLTKLKWVGDYQTDGWVIKFILGIVGVLLGADVLVRSSSGLAVSLGIPAFLVGILVVAVGTSLPELVLEIQAVSKKNLALVFGNLLGSIVANSTLIIGVTALIMPIRVGGVSEYLLAGVSFAAVFGLFWAFSMTKKRLDRWEALVLLGLYVMFVGLELLVG